MGRFCRHDGDDVHHHHHRHHDHDHHHGHDHYHGHDHIHLVDPDDTSHGDHSDCETGVECVTILEDILNENDHCIGHNHELLADHGVEAISLMSSPDSGKTTLLERTLVTTQDKLCIGIIEGGIEIALDVNRLEGHGTQISLLDTSNGFGGECHLDVLMVLYALEGLDLSTLDLVMIENMGNLVCPAESEVGEARKATVYSLAEGEGKPIRRPVIFHSVQVVVIDKMDFAPHPGFDMKFFRVNLERVNPGVKVIKVSVRTGEGINKRLHWANPALID